MSSFLTTRQAATLLGLSVAGVQRRVRSGELPVALRIGNRLRFDAADLAEWVPPKPDPRRPIRGRLQNGAWVLTHAAINELPTDGWAYFIQPVDGGPIKIGTAADVDSRLRALQFASPARLVLLRKLPGGRRTEARLHKRFAAHRLHGEWFDEHAPGLSELARAA